MDLKNFDEMLQMLPKNKAPRRVVLVGSSGENMLKGLFQAQQDGFVFPVLVGQRSKTMEQLEKLGLEHEQYTFFETHGENPANMAILAIKNGDGDILMRGDTLASEFLRPVLTSANGLRPSNSIVSHVTLTSMPGFPKLLALSDMAVIITPDMSKKRAIIKNTVKVLNALGYEYPKLAMLALIEKGTFHMTDTLEAQTLIYEHQRREIAHCELWGPTSYDLIMSKESARLKGYDCPHSGEFDAIIAPELTTANTLVKSWMIHTQAEICGAVIGTNVPIALTSRSATARDIYLSAALTAILEDRMSDYQS